MVKKILKVTGIILGVIVMIIAAYYTKVYISTENRLHKKYNVQLQPINIKADSAEIAYGARLIKTKGCSDCHGQDLGGKVFVDDAALGLLIASNLTKGKGGRPSGLQYGRLGIGFKTRTTEGPYSAHIYACARVHITY
jgi:hypothetical protein